MLRASYWSACSDVAENHHRSEIVTSEHYVERIESYAEF